MEYIVQIILAAAAALIIFVSLTVTCIVHRAFFSGTEDIDPEILIAISAAVSRYRKERSNE